MALRYFSTLRHSVNYFDRGEQNANAANSIRRTYLVTGFFWLKILADIYFRNVFALFFSFLYCYVNTKPFCNEQIQAYNCSRIQKKSM